jgi:hypothetical protein
MHAVAFGKADHVSTVVPPAGTSVELKVIVGPGMTVTFVVAVAVPPGPVQVRVKG